MKEYKRLIAVFGVLILILAVGVIGYSQLLRLSFLDALYMTVITISTVGYKEVAEMTPQAKLFTIFIIFLGLSFVGYLFTSVTVFVLEGNMKKIFKTGRLKKKMNALEDHYILCGAGETGTNVIRQFKRLHVPFVVIENSRERADELLSDDIITLFGDATDEEILTEAGILKARGLISTLSTDADNVFTVLTARYLNKDLYIISRSFDGHSREKLTRAGANRTISPNEIGGRRMASLMLRPTVITFLDLIYHIGDVDLDLEEVVLFPGSVFINMSLREAQIPDKTGLIILALQKRDSDKINYNPGADVILETGDTMITIGTDEQVMKLKEIAKDTGKRELIRKQP